MFNRRDFLKVGGAGALVALAPISTSLAAPSARRVAVLVELKGGNDGLNTVVPFSDPAYAKLRPRLALSRDEVLKLDERVGLHPSLSPLMDSWSARELAVVQGVGYDDPNRSHFRSIEIWETATDSDKYADEGWLARALDAHSKGLATPGVSLGDDDVGPLRGDPRALTLRDPQRFLNATKRLMRPTDARSTNSSLTHVLATQRALLDASNSIEQTLDKIPKLEVAFPKTNIGRQLETAARLISGGVPLMAVKVTHGGFDTHANQLGRHAALLGQLADALAAFRLAMIDASRWPDTLVMTYSEFGRRAAQNGSMGTDHGTAAPHLLMGGRVRGGLHGKAPSLTDLAGGDLKHHVDFRDVYANVTRSFWGISKDGLGKRARLDLVKV